MSGPSWCSILTGHSQLLHRVFDNALETKSGRLPALPTVLGLVKQVQTRKTSSGGSAAAVINGDWDGIPNLCKRDADILKWFPDCTRPEEACTYAEELISSPNCPDIAFVYLDLIDYTGHKHGFGIHIPEYIAAIERADASIAPLIAAVRRREQELNEDWLILVTTDHGGSDRDCHADKLAVKHSAEFWGQKKDYKGIHGMDIPQHRQTFFIASRAGRPSREIIPAPKSEDVTVTLLAHFSSSAARQWLFSGVPYGHFEEEAQQTETLPNWSLPSKL